MRDDELRHLPRRNLIDVNFSISFERAARSQHCHPLNRIDVASDTLARRQKNVIFHVQNARSAVRAFEQFADANEIPTFAVGHGRVGDSLKKMRARDDALEKFVGTRAQQILAGFALHEKVESIDLLPHLTRHLFARAARILARDRETG